MRVTGHWACSVCYQRSKVTYQLQHQTPVNRTVWLRLGMLLLSFFFSLSQLLVTQGLSTDNHNEYTFWKAVEGALLNDTTGELFRLRDAFFPSSSMKKQFWKADDLQAIQFDAHLIFTDLSCNKSKQDPKSVFVNGTTVNRCWAYQWTNSYLLGLVATQELYQLEPVLTALIYLQTVGHREVDFNIKLNVSDPMLCLITEDDLYKYFTSFISWTKAYAAAHGLPSTWNDDDLGYVSRKYNTYTKGIEHSQLYDTINYAILVCFISANLVVVSVQIAFGGKLFNKACSITNGRSVLQKSSCKSVLLVTAFLLVPLYLCGLFVAHTGGVYPKHYLPCNATGTECSKSCIPSSTTSAYILEVTSFYFKVIILLLVLLLYLASAFLTVVKNASLSHLLLRRHSKLCRCVEVYTWWCALIGIHILIGLASIPILIFFVITPTYTIFFVFCIGIIISILSLPPVLCLLYCQGCDSLLLASFHRTRTRCLWFFCVAIIYSLGASLTVSLLYLYYSLLIGGASMNSTKGVLLSLLPPAVIAVSGFYIRHRFFKGATNSFASEHSSERERININTEQDT